jgi:radical SAM protein with 4Fe4S-binding SPASM domain
VTDQDGLPLNTVYSDSRKVSNFLGASDPSKILAQELGEKFSAYRRRWDEAKNFKSLPPFPIHVDYELKSACNLRCPMCPMALRKPQSAPKAELSFSLAKDLIDEGVCLGQASMGFGGLWEPLISPHIASLVSYGREKGLADAMMSTNGYYLAPDISKSLIEAGLTRLMVSLDAATEKTYRLMRPGSDFERVESNIESFIQERQKAKSRLPLLRLSFCFTKANEAEWPLFYERWKGRADFFSLQNYGRFGSEAPALFPANKFVPAPSGLCAQPFKRLLVRHDGTVLPCCDLSGLALSLGNASRGLKNIWEGEALADLRNRLKKGESFLPKACLECQNKYQP